MKRPAVFFDRDNTLIVSDGYLGDPDGVVLVEGAADVVARVRRLGYAAITFSNQSGVARGLFTEQDVHRVNSRLDEMLLDHEAGAIIDRHEFCPHHPEAAVPRYRQASEFRKPAPGMIYQAARQLGLDLSRSWVVGDAPRDIEAGRAAGCRTILFKGPALPASAAATEPSAVEPDFFAANLKEVADLIEAHPPTEELVEPMPAVEERGDPVVPAAMKAQVAAEEGDAGAAASAPVVEPDVAESVVGSEEPDADPPHAVADEPYRKVSVEASYSSEAMSFEAAAPAAPALDRPAAATQTTWSQEQEQPSAASVEAAIAEEPAPAPEQEAPAEPAEEHVMEDRSAGESPQSGGTDSHGTASVRRRSPPAVILAAKAARAAARNSVPDASAEILREVARNAARAAAMGIMRDYSAAAPDQAEVDYAAEPGPASVVAPSEASAERSRSTPQEPMIEPTTESPRYAETSAPVHQAAVPDAAEERGGAPDGNLNRLEDITEQILLELRRRNDAGSDFSVSKLMAGITMVISMALLGYAYFYKNDPTTLHSLLLLGLMLQSITISLLIMGRQK